MKVSTDHPVRAAVGPPVPVVEPVPARRGHVAEHASLVPGHVAPEVVLVPRVHAEQRAVVGGRHTLGPVQRCHGGWWVVGDLGSPESDGVTACRGSPRVETLNPVNIMMKLCLCYK